MEIGFSNPHYLWLLAPIPLFFFAMVLFLIRGKKDIGRFISFHALEFIFKKGNFISNYIKRNCMVFMFRVVIYATVVFIIAGTTLYYNGMVKDGAIAIAVDSSGSMIAEDIKPNRLEAVKETINVFLERIPLGSKVAVLSFSGNSYVEQRLSNKDKAIKGIENIQISPISGTSIGNVLRTSINILDKERKPKLVVLISDGGENIISKEELDKIVDEINKKYITVDAIGIGKMEGARLPGTELPSALNEPLLEDIAKKTGGLYFRAETKESLTEAYEKVISSTKLKIPVNRDSFLIIISILLLLVDYILAEYTTDYLFIEKK